MLTPNEFAMLCQHLALSEQAQKLLRSFALHRQHAVLGAEDKMFLFAILAGKWVSSFKQKAAL